MTHNHCGKGEFYICGLCMLIGVAEVAHVAAVFLHWDVKRLAAIFGVGIAVLCAMLAVWLLWKRGRRMEASGARVHGPEVSGSKISTPAERSIPWLGGALALSVLFQIILIAAGDMAYRDGDMTLETVQTFLAQNGVYTVNPLTGQPYSGGIPLRLQILCLPGLYTAICTLTGIEASVLIFHVWPVVVLLASYAAFAGLAGHLFGKDRKTVLILLLIVSALIWMGDYMVAMDGFQLMHCGYRGTALRNCVLVPFALHMSLKKNWFGVILAILAEACIVWTLYGMGVCVLVAALTLLIRFIISRREGMTCRNS